VTSSLPLAITMSSAHGDRALFAWVLDRMHLPSRSPRSSGPNRPESNQVPQIPSTSAGGHPKTTNWRLSSLRNLTGKIKGQRPGSPTPDGRKVTDKKAVSRMVVFSLGSK
jgi:hypothetical protein